MRAELEVRAAHERGDVPTVIVRPPWFYGPWQPERQTTFFSMVAAGRFPVPGDGSQRRSMAYVDNLVQGVALAERHPAAPGQAFWVADRDAYPLRRGGRHGASGARRGGVPHCAAPPSGSLGWSPRVAEAADRVLQRPRPLLRPAPRAGRAGQDHPLRHHPDGRGARLRPAGRPARRGCGASVRWCVRHGIDIAPRLGSHARGWRP